MLQNFRNEYFFQLGERLRQIRSRIVASGEPLLTQDEIEKEIASRRGGLQETEA